MSSRSKTARLTALGARHGPDSLQRSNQRTKREASVVGDLLEKGLFICDALRLYETVYRIQLPVQWIFERSTGYLKTSSALGGTYAYDRQCHPLRVDHSPFRLRLEFKCGRSQLYNCRNSHRGIYTNVKAGNDPSKDSICSKCEVSSSSPGRM